MAKKFLKLVKAGSEIWVPVELGKKIINILKKNIEYEVVVSHDAEPYYDELYTSPSILGLDTNLIIAIHLDTANYNYRIVLNDKQWLIKVGDMGTFNLFTGDNLETISVNDDENVPLNEINTFYIETYTE